jgi:hypothetical protein
LPDGAPNQRPEHESAAIMTKVAANVEKSTDARRQYVYKQSIISNLVRSNGKTARLHSKGCSDNNFKIMPCCGDEYMKLIDVLKGTGTVLTESGRMTVQYDLEVYEAQIRGWIRPHLGKLGERLTLQMQDGTSLRFLFVKTDGAVTANDGIIPAE